MAPWAMARSPRAQAEKGGMCIGLVSGGSAKSSYAYSLANLVMFDGANRRRLTRSGCGLIWQHCSSGDIAAARNALMRSFLVNARAEWLVLIDSDMGFEPSLAEHLIAGAGQVGGVCGALAFGLRADGPRTSLGAVRYRMVPTIYEWVEQKRETYTERGFGPVEDYPRDTLVACDATGMAAVAIRRDVAHAVTVEARATKSEPFDKITVPECGPGGSPSTFSEDLSWFIRLAKTGIPLVVDTSARTAHDKGGVFLDEESYDQRRVG